MDSLQELSHKYLYSRLFIVFATAFSLLACGQPDAPKIASRKSNNGKGSEDGGFQKPTPNTGYQIFGASNMMFMGAREALRIVDIATHLKKAKSLNPCQRLMDKGSTILITLKEGCNPNGVGKEEILVERNAENKIVKIELNKDIDNRDDLGLAFDTIRGSSRQRTETHTEVFESITLTSQDGVHFDVNASLKIDTKNKSIRIKKAKRDSDRLRDIREDDDDEETTDDANKTDEEKKKIADKKRKERREEASRRRKSRLDDDGDSREDERFPRTSVKGLGRTLSILNFTGKLELTQNAPLLTVHTTSFKYELYEGDGYDAVGVIDSTLVDIDTKNKDAKRVFTCGVADGTYIIEQNITIDEKSSDAPVQTPIQIVDGEILNQLTQGKHKIKSCGTSLLDLFNSNENMNRTESVRKTRGSNRDNARYSRFEKPQREVAAQH